MRLYYWKDEGAPNFGDDLNAWLWPRLIPDVIDDDSSCLFVGIGTLLNDLIPRWPRRKVVFGTGAGYGRRYPDLDRHWRIFCVRGPLTARALGLPSGLSITDAAALVRTLDLTRPGGTDDVSFMPHCATARYGDWRPATEAAGLRYVDPSGPVERTLNAIRSSRLLLTEAMHGAIVADALRVPWIALRTYRHILEFKWHDWCQSVGLQYEPAYLPPLWHRTRSTGVVSAARGALKRGFVVARLRWIAAHHRPVLSADGVIQSLTERLHDRLASLREDHRSGRIFEEVGEGRIA